MIRRGLVGLVAAISLVGCSWVFQHKLDKRTKRYEGLDEPECTTGKVWPIIDGVSALTNGLSAAIAIADEKIEYRALYIVSGIASTVIHIASAYSGVGWSDECQQAVREWEENTQQAATDESPRRAEREEAPAPTPRGFFCSASIASPDAAFCARMKLDCQRARMAGLGAVPDLSECALQETAFCFGEEERCTPDERSCEAQRGTANVADCIALH